MPINFPNNPITNQEHITIDNKRYVYDGVKWVFDICSFSEKCHAGAVAPIDPSSGDLWWNSENGTLYVYYDDGNSQQWVVFVLPSSDGGITPGEPGRYLISDSTGVYWGWATMPGIIAPTVTVTGTEVSGVTGYRGDEIITITGSVFTVNDGEDVHAATDWRIVRDSDGATVWESLDDAVNLTSVDIPANTVGSDSTAWVRHRGVNSGYSEWSTVSIVIAFSATGGTVTTEGGYVYHTFTESGVFKVSGEAECEVLIVAGGGGGNLSNEWGDGSAGGGAGGFSSFSVLPLGVYTILVGAGGAINENGNDSIAFNETAIGGGRMGNNGGSGGGGNAFTDNAAGLGTSGQGNNGGVGYNASNFTRAAGGGGGAGQAGQAGSSNQGGKGGDGLPWNNGSYYAGGGGAGSRNGNAGIGGLGGGGNVNEAGEINTGSGGGGGHRTNQPGAPGGSGVVIIRYAV